MGGEAAVFDAAKVIDSHPQLSSFRDRLASMSGGSMDRAQKLVEDMLIAAMHGFCGHALAAKGGLIEDVLRLRGRLDDILHGVLQLGPGRTGAKFDSTEVESIYRQLDQHLRQLAQPLHDQTTPSEAAEVLAATYRREIEAVDPSASKQSPRAIDEDFHRESGWKRIRALRKGLRKQRDGSYVVRFTDGASARYRVVDGHYQVTTFNPSGEATFSMSEFDVLHTPYRNAPKTTSLMNCHHGLQDSLMKQLFADFGYDGGDVPTIWLRDGRAGSPHGLITAIQKGAKISRSAKGVTFSDIRQWAIADLKAAGATDARITEYLAAFDAHFRRTVLPKLPASEKGRLGTWIP